MIKKVQQEIYKVKTGAAMIDEKKAINHLQLLENKQQIINAERFMFRQSDVN